MTPVLLDTGPIVALLDSSDRDHQKCVAIANELDAPFVTCEAVIAETCYLLQKLKGASNDVLSNIDKGIFRLPYRVAGRAVNISKLLSKFADVPMAFADACLVDMAGQLSVGRIWTLDSDFQIYRWGRNRPFEIIS